jgi:Flp pilus assembly protein TadD
MDNADKKKVVVITSDAEHVKATRHSLGSFGIKDITIMENGLVAMEKIKSTTYDFLLCDQDSKLISGWLLIKEIKVADNIPNIPVVLFGKSNQPDTDENLKKYGVVKYLKSPFTASTLDFLIHSTLSLASTSGTIENKFSKAKSSLIANKTNEAIEMFNELKSLTKNSSRSLIGLAQSYEQSGDIEKADLTLEELAKGQDDTPSRALMQTRLCLKTGKVDEAYGFSRKLLSSMPNGFYYTKVVRAFLDANQFKSAETFSLEALEKKMEIIDFYICIAKCNYAVGVMEEALLRIEEAGQKFGLNADLHNLKGVCLKKEGKYQEALTAYEEAFRLSPTDPKIYFNMAMCSIGMKDYATACRHLESCLKISPNFPKASEKLSEIRAFMEKTRLKQAS